MSTLKDITTGKSEKYLTDEYKEEQFGNGDNSFPENVANTSYPVDRGTVLRPVGGAPISIDAEQFSYPTSQKSIWDEGFAGSTFEDLDRYRSQNQGTRIKGLYTVGAGIISGVGTFLEDVGYLLDYATYAAMFSDMDFSTANSMNLYRRITKGISDVGLALKESTNRDILPVYEQAAEEGNYTDMLFKWSSLKSIIDSAVGFGMTGLGVGTGIKAATKSIIKGITKAGKKSILRSAALTRSVSPIATKAAKLQAYTNLFAQTNPKVVQALGATTTSIFTKGAEARMEGLESYENTLHKMQPLVENGIITKSDAEQFASESANEAFDYTMATFIGDAMMLKGLFRGKAAINKKLLSPTRWNRNKAHLFGAPKEGFEEMWQEAAKMEGNYQAFQSLKESLKLDEDLKKMKKLGLDPSGQPERWSERFSAFLDSTEAKVAGTIGLISGPFQSKAMSLPGRKQRIKEQWENYNNQQSRYKDNEKLFGSQHKFKETIKQVATSSEMREISQLLADDELANLSEEAALLSIATSNFTDGTINQLRDIIKEEGSPESQQLLTKLDKMTKDFKKSKKYINPNEMFVLDQNIKLTRKTIEHLKSYKANPYLDKKTLASYNKAIDKLETKLESYNQEYLVKSSKNYQLNLADQESYINELMKVKDLVSRETSITKLERYKKQFPELISEIDSKITDLRNIGNTSKQSSTKQKNVVKTNNNKNASPNSNRLDGQLEVIANKIVNNKELTKEESDTRSKYKESVGDLVSNIIFEKKENVDTEGNVYSNNMPVQNREDIKSTYRDTGLLQTMFNTISTENDSPNVEVTDNILDEFADFYLDRVKKVNNIDELNGELFSKVNELYTEASTTSPIDPDSNISESYTNPVEQEKSNPIDGSLASQAGIKLLDSLSEEITEDLPSDIDPIRLRNQEIKEQVDLLLNFVEAVSIETNRDILTEDFKSFIQALEQFTDLNVRPYYNKIKTLYTLVTDKEISETYEELLGIEEKDPSIAVDQISSDKIQNTLEIATKYISPTQNSIQLQEIYSDSEVQNVDSKNSTPATSVAHLSQQYIWEVKGKKQVGRETSDTSIEGNPILNPFKYNAGTKVNVKLNTEYNGKIKLSTGKRISWQVMLEEYNIGDWNHFIVEHNLAQDETIFDYWPMTIEGTENKELIGFVHDVAWINRLNVVEDVIDSNVRSMRNFRNELIPTLQESDESIFETTVIEKVLDIHKENGYYTGFALNTNPNLDNTLTSLPDSNLKIGTKIISDIEIPKNRSLVNNIMNVDFLDNYNSGISFVFIPLAEKDGKIKYHAAPLINDTVNI